MKNLRIHPATWLFLFVLLLTGFSGVIIPYLIAVSLHELAHGFVAKKCGYSLNKIWILPYGASISFKEFSFSPKDEVKIAVAGPVMNGILIVITIMLWWIFPAFYIYSYSFVLSNFSIMVFNLLPAFPLDGGRILTSLLRTKFKPKTVYKTTLVLNLLFSLVFLILFVVSAFFKINFSFGLTSIFLFLGIFEGKFQGNYSPLLAQFSCPKKQILPVKTLCISSSTPLYKIFPHITKNKFTILYIRFPNNSIKMLTEPQLEKLFQSCNHQETIEDIFKK